MTSEVPKIINFVDLGFEDGLRIQELSGRPGHQRKVFLGIERPGIKDRLKPRYPNLELRYGGVLEELKAIADGTVRIVNADFFFTEFYTPISDLDLPSRVIQPLIDQQRAETVEQVRRVLVPQGRFYVTEYKGNLRPTLTLLTENGFPSCEHRQLDPGEMDKTKFLRLIKSKLEQEGSRADDFQPIRILARKTD